MIKGIKMRSFIAVEVDSKVKKNINETIKHFKKNNSGVKWIKPEAIHLTLKFLGNIDMQKSQQTTKIMDALCSNHNPFFLSFIGLVTFPQKSRIPKVIWAGVKENDLIQKLDKSLENELEKIGFSREKRDFHPHLTLGRIKKNAVIHNLLPELKKHESEVFGESKVERIILFKSTLTPSGAVYDILHESQLG